MDVNSFSTTSHTSDSGHVVDDEPGTPTSGTELFHRDETSGYGVDVVGSGSYTGGSANATYNGVEVGTLVTANNYTRNFGVSTGYYDDGEAFSLDSHYSDFSNDTGTLVITHAYADSGSGLALTGATLDLTGSTTVNSRA